MSSLALCTPWGPKSIQLDGYVSAPQQDGGLPLLRNLNIVDCQTDPLELDPLAEVCNVQGIALRYCDISESMITILGDAFIRN